MRGLPYFNFPAFFIAADELTGYGYSVFNPAAADEASGFDWRACPDGSDGELESAGFDIRSALRVDTEWICLHAEAIIVLSGWEASFGAQAEVFLGRALGLPVMDVLGRRVELPLRTLGIR